jgi:hypothetical protein
MFFILIKGITAQVADSGMGKKEIVEKKLQVVGCKQEQASKRFKKDIINIAIAPCFPRFER